MKIKFSDVALFCLWSVILGMLFYFMRYVIMRYANTNVQPSFGNTLLNKQLFFYAHITAGSLALLTGPLQFWKAFRTKYMRFHRITGKIYIIASLIAALCLIRLIKPGPDAPSQTVVTILWFICTIAAWWTIKRKNIKAHKQFMARSYVFAFFFVEVRIYDMLGESIFSSVKKDGAWLANTDWLAWVVPFLILEMYQSWWPVARVNFNRGETRTNLPLPKSSTPTNSQII